MNPENVLIAPLELKREIKFSRGRFQAVGGRIRYTFKAYKVTVEARRTDI